MSEFKRRGGPTQHVPSERARRLAFEGLERLKESERTLLTWLRILGNPSPRFQVWLASYLTRQGLTPQAVAEEVGAMRERGGLVERETTTKLPALATLDVAFDRATLEEKAAILEAATAVWSGAYSFEEIKECYPQIDLEAVRFMCEFADLDAYWRRPGVRLGREEVRERERLDPLVKRLSRQLRQLKQKGGH